MSMTPHDFHALLDEAVAHAPLTRGIETDVAAGRRLLRRRRTLTAAGTALAAVVVAGSLQAFTGGGPSVRDARDLPVAGSPTTLPATAAAELLRQCRDGNQSSRATAAIFDAGDAVVRAQVRTEHQVILAIEAGDGAHWAECFVHLDRAEFKAGMTVYDASGTATDNGYTFGPGCGLVDGQGDPGCATWTISTVDRLPAEVAAVRYDLGDGASTTVVSQDGYVVLNHLATLPAGASVDEMGQTHGFDPLTRITYLDGSGRPIAAQAEDGSGSGPDHERVDGLPLLRDYPSLRAPQAVS